MSEDTENKQTANTKAVKESATKTNDKVIGSGTTSGKSKTKRVAAVGAVADGVIGSSTKIVTVSEPEPAKPTAAKETVAIYSTKNVSWDGYGKVSRGYNILSKEVAEKWLAERSHHTRLATPEEVAKEFGV
jgi:hypothetical protein